MADSNESDANGGQGAHADDGRKTRDAESVERGKTATEAPTQGSQEAQGDPMKTVWIYINTDALPGDVDYVQVFASEEAANRWIDENDPEGFAFEYPVQE